MTSSISRKPVNGKVWKTRQQQPISQTKNRMPGQGWEKRQVQRNSDAVMRAMKSEHLLELEGIKVERKKRLEANRKRKEENEQKAELVQSVSAAKVKRMNKKQLRMIRKSAV